MSAHPALCTGPGGGVNTACAGGSADDMLGAMPKEWGRDDGGSSKNSELPIDDEGAGEGVLVRLEATAGDAVEEPGAGSGGGEAFPRVGAESTGEVVTGEEDTGDEEGSRAG
eukprot:RCo046138